MNRRCLYLSIVLALPPTFVAGVAQAQPPAGSDPAAAQALFYEARTLMRDGKYGVACPKLEESLKLDYGIGTEFNLADCHEKLGKLATAWSGFINVASAARTQRQPQREQVARERAKALEPRMPKLTIDVAATSTPGIEVTRDGAAVGAATFGTAVPVDPGAHKIVASAPGRQSWEGTVTVTEGKSARVSVPVLAIGAAPGAVAAGPEATPAEPSAPEKEPAPQYFPAPIIERGQTQRSIGWVIAGAGVVGLGIGGGFGLSSLQSRSAARSHCEGDLCDGEGVTLRSKAISSGNVATIAGIGGAALVIGGLVVVLTAPKNFKKEAPPPSRAIRAVPLVGLNSAGLSLEGVLP